MIAAYVYFFPITSFFFRKFEEIYPPETKDYIYMTDDTYEIKHLLLMERAVLKELNFDVSVPTAAWFANRITHFVPIAETTRFAMEYMLDLTLLDTEYLEFKPSYVAAACLCYANLLCGTLLNKILLIFLFQAKKHGVNRMRNAQESVWNT